MKGKAAAMNEPVTTTTLADWLRQTPTIVIYRHDGQLSLDQLPNMTSPDAVVCFATMDEAKCFLKSLGKRRKEFRPVNLSVDDWLAAIKAEAVKGRTHLSVWELPGGGKLTKRSVRIADVVKGFDVALKAIQEEIEQPRNHTPHQQTEGTCRDGIHSTSTVKAVKTCPRCGGPIPSVAHAGLYPGGISRVDGKTEICSACSEDEAMTWPNDPWKEETWAKEQRARWIRQ
jgi:hypothetical protein